MEKRVRINNAALIKAVGGARKFARKHAELADQLGFTHLPEDTIRSWMNRNIMKYERLPEVYMIAAYSNIVLDMRDFVEMETETGWVSFTVLGFCCPPKFQFPHQTTAQDEEQE